MRISDWSSDVCSSDLSGGGRRGIAHPPERRASGAGQISSAASPVRGPAVRAIRRLWVAGQEPTLSASPSYAYQVAVDPAVSRRSLHPAIPGKQPVSQMRDRRHFPEPPVDLSVLAHNNFQPFLSERKRSVGGQIG